MHSLHDDCYSLRFKRILQDVGDLARHALPHLKAARIHIHNPGNFRESNHLTCSTMPTGSVGSTAPSIARGVGGCWKRCMTPVRRLPHATERKSTRLNSSHHSISYA